MGQDTQGAPVTVEEGRAPSASSPQPEACVGSSSRLKQAEQMGQTPVSLWPLPPLLPPVLLCPTRCLRALGRAPALGGPGRDLLGAPRLLSLGALVGTPSAEPGAAAPPGPPSSSAGSPLGLVLDLSARLRAAESSIRAGRLRQEGSSWDRRRFSLSSSSSSSSLRLEQGAGKRLRDKAGLELQGLSMGSERRELGWAPSGALPGARAVAEEPITAASGQEAPTGRCGGRGGSSGVRTRMKESPNWLCLLP